MEERKGGRGRARGQARAPPAPQARPPAPQPGPGPGPSGWPQGPPHHRQQQATVPQASGWARPPANVQPSSSRGRGAREPQPGPSGDDGMQIEKRFRSEGPGEQSLAPRQGGNGGVRGARRDRFATVASRPKDLPTKQGSTGNRVRLISNFFELRSSGKWALHQYRVDFAPNIEQTPYRKRLARTGLIDKIPGYLFDGTVLYSPARLNPDPLEVFVKDDQDQNIQISIRRVGEIDWGDPHYLQVFNIIVRKCLASMKLELIGRNYFDPSAKTDLPEHKLQLWPGYSTSIRQHETSILMNVEIQFKVIRTDNVFDYFRDVQNPHFKQDICNKLLGAVVLTAYNNKTYRIDDIEWKLTPESKFEYGKEGRKITYIDYMKQKYNIRIRYTNQPLLVSRAKPREIRAGMAEYIHLIPELCQMTGLTDQQRKNFRLMRALAQYTRLEPSERVQRLNRFSQKLRDNKMVMEELRRWEFDLDKNLTLFSGRELNQEQIVAYDNKRLNARNGDWMNGLRESYMLSCGKMDTLAVIFPGFLQQKVERFVGMLRNVSRNMGLRIDNVRFCDMRDDRLTSYVQCVSEVADSMRPTMALVVLNKDSVQTYSTVKSICTVQKGLPSQMVLAKRFDGKGAMSIATKIAVQINVKIGGAPWCVPMNMSGVMFVGYDVCRDTVNKKKSFAAMCATLDKHATRYFSQTYEHTNEEEMSAHFAAFLVLACHEFKNVNGNFPSMKIIFRDGVGDGQLPYVYEQEVQSIKEKLTREIYTMGNLTWAFIVVNKRINTRFFKVSSRGSENPACGTVVDNTITLPERYDFFLVSQCTREGTVSPTSYNILEDSTGLTADHIQILTYKLTHMYYNWTGPIKVPAPVQYAHKLAFQTAQYLHQPGHSRLNKLLNFL